MWLYLFLCQLAGNETVAYIAAYKVCECVCVCDTFLTLPASM